MPIFHVPYRHKAVQPSATSFVPDTPGVEIHASVQPLLGETVVIKHFPNSFRETALLEHLREADVKDLIICGAMSHMCIDATTRAAFDLGFHCIVAADACATRAVEQWANHRSGKGPRRIYGGSVIRLCQGDFLQRVTQASWIIVEGFRNIEEGN
jgi:nicotinamidase-related amidase